MQSSDNTKLIDKMKSGAVVIDVRTRNEFAAGHLNDSLNIPLSEIPNKVTKLKSLNKPLVLCCASGARSGQAKRFLETKGLKDIYNGGSWRNVPKS